ncbi:hypothetical protein QR98_0077870 [Sarcoptes scabiei]|uniref:Uncharacterized protein n=1 Tax=Sarcoptes scabiei TaxID=52283 RepID=A0A132AE89_SARSC|nr:hypothetical protein QR98_0077870 [Sarcoptes scabiei]
MILLKKSIENTDLRLQSKPIPKFFIKFPPVELIGVIILVQNFFSKILFRLDHIDHDRAIE